MNEIPVTPDKDPSRRADAGAQEYVHTEREFISDMEFEIYVDKLTVQYTGSFRYPALLEAIKEWCRLKGYYHETLAQKTKITSSGRNSSFSFTLQKKFSQLYLSYLVLDLTIQDMADVTIPLGGRQVPYNKGKVTAVINGFLGTSMKARVESRPRMAIIRGIIDRFIYKLDRPIYPGTVVQDGVGLATHIRSFFGLEQKRLEKAVPA